MTRYFAREKSIATVQQGNIPAELRTIANHYMGENPVCPPVFRISLRDGFCRQADYRYVFDLSQRFPDAGQEQAVYAWAKIWFDQDGEACFSASADGPMTVWIDGREIYHSNYEEERDSARIRKVTVPVKAGWNQVVIEFLKTALGFGGCFGTGRFKNFPFHFLMPLPDTEGWEGWAFTAPQPRLPHCDFASCPELAAQQDWLPRHQWMPNEQGMPKEQRIFGDQPGKKIYAWTKARIRRGKIHITGQAYSPVCLHIGLGNPIDIPAGQVDRFMDTAGGELDIVSCMEGRTGVWGASISFAQDEKLLSLQNPAGDIGCGTPWLFLGPLEKDEMFAGTMDLAKVCHGHYWQADVPGGQIRPFLESSRFGKWNYPLGVTLYGLLTAARLLDSMEMKQYIWQHVECCTSYYEYSLWDKEQFGAAGINNQLSNVDSLDDCGSFASLMLELDRDLPTANSRQIADDTADYIAHGQTRLVDGTLCRGQASLAEMNGTMWADDLYMSVPFLCRYYELTGNQAVLDDAAHQYLRFRHYLFIPEKKIMSHVYLTDRQLANRIPWGRGNGWVLFSLSELLRVLPQDHANRSELLAFFQELCAGYLALQDEDGMWHQVLTDPTAYQEASCTAMFVSAFSRGIRNGWLTEQEPYIEAVERGWQGLTEIAVDAAGNVYGICQGSGYSFRSTYYRDELTWVLNDPHGIGIVLMAGTECLKLRRWLLEQ